MRIKLSQNFYLDEFTRSGIARRLGVDNTPDARTILHLEALADFCLQPIRDHFGPVIILSGYRCPVVNAASGSSDRSAHPWGWGGDLTVPGVTTREVALWASDQLPKFDQIIDEFGEWVHIGYKQPRTEAFRMQLLEAYHSGTKTRYKFI